MAKKKLKQTLKESFKIFRNAITNYGSNRPVQLAGTTAYFAIFSMAPILIIIIGIFGYFTGDAAIRDKLFDELTKLIGSESAQVLRNAIDNYNLAEKSDTGTVLGILFFLISATTLFSIMQLSINYIWRVQVKSNFKMGLLNLLKTRILSFGVILCLGFVMLISLIIDASIAFLKDFMDTHLSFNFVLMAQLINVALSLTVIASVFALIFRYLPDVHVSWKASWFGAVFSSFLFAIGKLLIGLIVGNSNLGVVYGAASSFVVILVWIYFVSIIFYFGVELSHQYSRFYHHKNKPAKFAVPFEIQKLQ